MQNVIFKNFKDVVAKFSAGKTVGELFSILGQLDLSRIEMMIVDSAIKQMSLERVYKTLLITQEDYYQMLQDITYKLYKLYRFETAK